MKNTVKQTDLLERVGTYDETQEHRYELMLRFGGKKGKRILVIGLNPTSDNIQELDTTTKHLLNNLGGMGYTEIVIWNLYADICCKLKPSEVSDNETNVEYLKELLNRGFDTILLGYGNTFIGNKKMDETKYQVHELLKLHAKAVYELTDKNGVYSKLKVIHPLFAGQRFNGEWKLKKFINW